jgi:ABC-type sulfate/molybdate transport systems ATPase subunit
VHELPQGIRQLFAVGKGRMREFDLLLLDEPFQHLDAAIHRDVRLVLQQLVRHLGRTVVVSLTEAEDVLAMSDYALVLQEGRLIEEGESGALYRQPETLCAMEMLSPLGLNRIPVEVSGERVRSLGLPAAGCVDGVKELCFRPEDAGPEAPYELPFELERRAVFDGKRDLLEGRIGGELVSLMWPVSADTPSRVFLRTYRLFDRTAP